MGMQVIGQANVMANITMWQNVKFKKEIREALELTAKRTESSAVQMAPKDTGGLKGSMWSAMISDTEAHVGDGVYYGIFQEKGTARFPAQPFLLPAFEANKNVFQNYMKEVLR